MTTSSTISSAPTALRLVGSGAGVHFDANKGTPMKEWFSLDPESDLDWLDLGREALEFAREAALGAGRPQGGSGRAAG
jgi:hypothetical protein